MFEILPYSGAHLDRRLRWLPTSLATHVLLVTLAVTVTRAALDDGPSEPRRDAILLFAPKLPEPSLAPAPKPEHSAPVVSVADPPQRGFQTIEALRDIPTVLPPIDSTDRPFDPRDFTERGARDGVADGVLGNGATVGLNGIYDATTNVPGFEAAVVLSQPTPAYPASLQSVGVEGRVVMEFVIDTSGRVAPKSFRVIESTHPAFESAARKTILASLFRPARIGHVLVRQHTRQAARFVAAH